ncbi:hypothetical protein BJ875DRAFT_448192 [Amylocarpus encephaloides]|uniref:Uncharacterized protein n=1 Tax=Amylocarpus encephaloides TaxID=45428 RepID=A0A9P7YT72_9HELO|nr:hypothetical protein BJ875DRAFT_448192 [Amylocarpus encephaloides]
MATAETVEMGPAHAPKTESIEAFTSLLPHLKRELQHLRHETNKHEMQYFQATADLPNEQLTNFSSDDLKEVRVATSAYGVHLFGKVLLPDSEGCYFMFRAFIAGEAEGAKLHCIHMEETERPDGDKDFRAIFGEGDKLEWFDV